MQICGQTWLNLVTWTCGSWSEGQHGLYFTVQWFFLMSWRLFDACTSYFRSMNQYDTTFYLKINVGHCDLYFMIQWLCLIPWRLFHEWTSLFKYMNQYDPLHDLKKCRSPWPLFHSPWFCLISWRLFDVCTLYFRSMNQYDPTFDLKINVGNYDLCFMVWWLSLLPWRLFHVKTSLFGIMNQYDPTHDLKINVGYSDLYFIVQRFCYILKTIWCMNIILGDYGSVWPAIWPLNNYVTVTCISWSTDFPLCLKYYLLDECHIFRWWDSVTQTLTSK